jgi:hypothetical protein
MESSVNQAADLDAVAFPVYSDDLHPDVRAGFDVTRDYVKRSIDRLERKIDALVELIQHPPAPPAPLPAAPNRYAQGGDRRPPPRGHEEEDHAAAHGGAYGRDRVGQAGRVPVDEGIGRVKITIPPFSGRCEPEDYLEREMRVEQIFDAHRYTEEKKVQLAGIEFTVYALVWWTQICRTRLRPTTWRGMKELL